MRDSFSGSMIAIAMVGAGLGTVISLSITGSHAQAPATSAPAPTLTTPLYEPRCNEGNYALPGLLRGRRMEELAFAEGRGPNPATRDSATGISGAEDDPLQ